VFLGNSHVGNVKVRNVGTDILNVTNITSNNSVFVPGSTNFSVQPGMEEIVEVTFTPQNNIAYNGILTITSNDSQNPIVNVVIQGLGAYRQI